MNLSEISFPVFRLNTNKPEKGLGLVYYMSESFNLDTAELKTRVRIVDDTNLEDSTLSRRRLRLKAAGAPTYPLKRCVFFLADLVKMSGKHWWIDSMGKVFFYKKSTRAKLRSYKIEQVLPAKGMGAIIQIKGIPQRFKVLYRPDESIKYATLVENWVGGRFLYGLTEEQHAESWRLI